MNRRFLDDLSLAMADVYASVTDEILVNLARHFKFIKEGQPVPASWDYQARKLAEVGQVNQETVQIILERLGGADEALKGLLEESIKNGLKDAEPSLRKAAEQGLLQTPLIPLVAPNQMQVFTAYYEQSADKLNLVNTVMLESTQEAYTATVADIVSRIDTTQTILNTATGKTMTGVSSFNKVLHDSVRRMVANNLTGFIDHGGHHWSPEAYVAMDMRTTMSNTAREAVRERSEEFGCELYQVSSHNGARPLCYPWQGKVISRNGWRGEVKDFDGNTVTVHSEDEIESFRYGGGLFGVNCGHFPIPFIPGFSRSRPPQQDEKANAKEYAESQEQRRLERELRGEKRELAVMKAQGATEEEIRAQKARVTQANDNLDSFCDSTGRARRREREYTPVKATFPPADSYDVSSFSNEQQTRIREFFKNGGEQQGYTFGELTPNVETPIEPESLPTPQLPKEVKETVAPDVVEQALNVQQYQPMSIEKSLEGANPNYNSRWGYNNNCQRCVQVYEMRRRGYPVEALPQKKGKNQIIWGSECFGGYGGGRHSRFSGFTWGQTEAQVKAELANAPDGARYSIYVDWKKENSAHVFIAEKVGNVVKYVDPQSNNDDVSAYFGRGRQNGFGFFRMDDKPITTDETLIKLTMKKGQ